MDKNGTVHDHAQPELPRHLVGLLAAASFALLSAWWLWTEASSSGMPHKLIAAYYGTCMHNNYTDMDEIADVDERPKKTLHTHIYLYIYIYICR